MFLSPALTALAVFVFMTAVFLVAQVLKDNSIVDIAWGPGFIIVAFISLFLKPGFTLRHALVTSLVCAWGIRPAVYIYLRKRGKGEDWRYARWRREWGRWFFVRSYFQIFMLQGLLMLVVGYPILPVNLSTDQGLTARDVLGLSVWLVGFFFEAGGDTQMMTFP